MSDANDVVSMLAGEEKGRRTLGSRYLKYNPFKITGCNNMGKEKETARLLLTKDHPVPSPVPDFCCQDKIIKSLLPPRGKEKETARLLLTKDHPVPSPVPDFCCQDKIIKSLLPPRGKEKETARLLLTKDHPVPSPVPDFCCQDIIIKSLLPPRGKEKETARLLLTKDHPVPSPVPDFCCQGKIIKSLLPPRDQSDGSLSPRADDKSRGHSPAPSEGCARYRELCYRAAHAHLPEDVAPRPCDCVNCTSRRHSANAP
ncbi:unnamed protein product [Spodoptera exigua]|nr:unnamed protein product [Spodoptera exigua]